MSSTRNVPIRAAFLQADKTPKSYQVLLAVTRSGTVSGVVLEKPSEHQTHITHCSHTSHARRSPKPMWVLTAKYTRLTPPWPVFKEPSSPPWLTDSYYRDFLHRLRKWCLLLLGLSSVWYFPDLPCRYASQTSACPQVLRRAWLHASSSLNAKLHRSPL